jgi:hypothetical protein
VRDSAAYGVAAVLLSVVRECSLTVARVAFTAIDPFHVTGIRYGIAVLFLVPLLIWRAGAHAIKYRGRFCEAAAVGISGMC